MYQCPPRAQYQYFNYSLFIVLLCRDDMKIHRSRNGTSVDLGVTLCAPSSLCLPDHITSQKCRVSLVTLLRAIDVIRTAEDSTIIRRCVAYRRIILRIFGTYVVNVEKERITQKTSAVPSTCGSSKMRQSLNRTVYRFIFMLQTITIALLTILLHAFFSHHYDYYYHHYRVLSETTTSPSL